MTDQAFLVNPAAQPQEQKTIKAADQLTATLNRQGFSKSPNAYRTISEASDELGVPQHVLRFWETKFSQIRPMKRSGGRRFYRPEDIELIRTIQTLLYDQGYTIKGVQRLLKMRRSLGAALQQTIDDIDDTPAEFAAVPPAPIDLTPEIQIRQAAADVVAQLADEIADDVAVAADAGPQALFDFYANTPAHVLEQIPDHLPNKPASLMATGIITGNPMPEPRVEDMHVEEPAATTGLSAEKRQQLQAMLAELKSLKTLLN